MKGGYSFRRLPAEVSILEVVETVDGRISPPGGPARRGARQRDRLDRGPRHPRPSSSPGSPSPTCRSARRASRARPCSTSDETTRLAGDTSHRPGAWSDRGPIRTGQWPPGGPRAGRRACRPGGGALASAPPSASCRSSWSRSPTLEVEAARDGHGPGVEAEAPRPPGERERLPPARAAREPQVYERTDVPVRVGARRVPWGLPLGRIQVPAAASRRPQPPAQTVAPPGGARRGWPLTVGTQAQGR